MLAGRLESSVPLDVLADAIQPFPMFSESCVAAMKALRGEIAAMFEAVGGRTRDLTRARPGT